MEHRAQHRIHSAVPVQIRGVDARGESFEEFTEAIEVSRRGLSFLTRRDLPVYASLTVVLPGRGPTRPGEGPADFFSEAAVVRVSKEGELNHVSLRFVGATLPTYTAETV
ncbi:MAG: PilZ domain-containing protein [Terriglobia bacterium]